MLKHIFFAFAVTATAAFAQSGTGNPTIDTGQYTSGRTASNANEVILNTTNVNVNQFGKLFSWKVDGSIFAQPLYVPGLSFNGKLKNVVFVATMHNSIYAFDADNTGPNATPIWSTNFGPSVPTPTNNGCPVPWGGTGMEHGVLGTPVIDKATQTLYAVSAAPYGISSQSPRGTGYQHYIHALDIITGQEKFGGPTLIQASVAGTGYNAQNGRINLGPTSGEVQRTSLLLANGAVYAGFGNCGPDVDPWHGWVVGYSASNLQNQKFVFNTTPNGGQGGIWQSARGLAADSAGDVYFSTGNATNSSYGNSTTGSSAGDAAQGNYAMRLLQLSSAGQFLASFPPPNYADLNNYDLDLSSSGPLVIPGTNLLIAGGKDGVIYVFNTSSFGNPIQKFQATGGAPCTYSGDGCDQIRDLAFWNNHLYVWGTNDVLRSFNLVNGQFNPTTASQNTLTVGRTPATLAVSASGTQSGIVWATVPDGTLRAFDGSNVAKELWNSNQNSARDALPSFVRFAEPTVANGRVYVVTASGQLAVYGLLKDFTVSASPGTQNVNQGSTTTFAVNVNAVAGFSSSVALSVSGLPTGVTAVFNPTSINGTGSSTLTINTASNTPAGTANLIISATGGGVTRTASASLGITTPDNTPPQATCCTYTVDGSSFVLHYTGQDTGSGMKSIIPVQLVNATASVPQFTAGTTTSINYTATQSGWGSYAKFQLTDVAGNSVYIDPMIFDPGKQPLRQTGAPVPFPVKGICKAKACQEDTFGEGTITIQNGSPGVKNLRVQVNDGLNLKQQQIAGLGDNELRSVDISSLLPDSGPVTVEIQALGKPGGNAVIIFGPGQIKPQQ